MNYKKVFFIFLVILAASMVTACVSPAQAKLLPRFAKGGTSSSAPRSYSTVIVTPRFLPLRNGLRVSFAGLSNASSVTYMLSYQTNGKSEGVRGTIDPSEGSITREMLFGTCSSGVCVNHMNITNMRLEITSKLTNGKTSIKRYSIQV